jgi:hypothetical protein
MEEIKSLISDLDVPRIIEEENSDELINEWQCIDCNENIILYNS